MNRNKTAWGEMCVREYRKGAKIKTEESSDHDVDFNPKKDRREEWNEGKVRGKERMKGVKLISLVQSALQF